jgi:phage gp36-like protein
MATGRAELSVSLHDVGAEAASGTGSSVDLGSDEVLARTAVRLDLDVSAVTSGPTSVSNATNTTPIVVTTTAAHGLSTGDTPTIAGVGGNTAANGTSAITVVDATSFSIDGSAGSGAYTSGGTVTRPPSLAVSLETSKDALVWVPLGAFDVVAAAGTSRRTIGGARRYVRAKWAIGGTGLPSFTFAIGGVAAIVYAAPPDIAKLALAAASLADFDIYAKADALWAASDELDLHLWEGFTFPLVSWPDDLRRHCSGIAAQMLKGVEGYSQEPGTRDVFKDMYDRAIAWAKATGKSGHPGIIDSTPTEEDAGAFIVTDDSRGWGGPFR